MRPDSPKINDRENLQSYIEGYTDKIDGRLGVLLAFPEPDGSLDVVASQNHSQPFNSASVIKLPILHALYHRYQENLDALDDQHGITERNRVGGSGLFHLLGDVSPSLRDLSRAMIAISDNAATNELIDHLGMDTINEQATTLGMEDTQIRRRMMASLGENDLKPQEEIPAEEPTNVTSPQDCVEFFSDLVQEKTLPSKAYTDMRVPLEEQKYVSHFPRYLPYTTHIEHKTGWIPSAALDTGLLIAGDAPKDRPLLFATFADQLHHGSDGADVLAEIGDATFSWLTG